MRRENLKGEAIYVIHDFLTPGECAGVIERSEAAGFEEATINTPGGAELRKDVRNNTRVITDDPDLAARMFEKAKPMLPAIFAGWRMVGLNERFRIYRYDPGQVFRKHYDGSFHRNDDEESRLTFMIYLNDGYSGGETKFYDFYESESAQFTVVPRTGMALVFRHPQVHEGAPVVEGRKYALRTDVMYRRTIG